MKIFGENEPLSDPELDRLELFLDSCGGDAMNIEEMDGFFAALIAGPGVVMPSEYLPFVVGGDTEDLEFEDIEEANEILGLMMRHWNHIAATLSKGDVHVPLLLRDEHGIERGNNWACGFILGTRFCHDAWSELMNDEDRAGCMVPALILYHEHDEDPAMRPAPISPKEREKVIEGMAVGLVLAYRHFREHPGREPGDRRPQGYATRKIGRNDPCPCGSGKKYKRCCGGATIH